VNGGVCSVNATPGSLEDLQVPIADLEHFGGNPRRGNVAVIVESLRVNGQYRPVVVNRRTMEVLAGNHTLRAARELGWETIAATFVDVDDATAKRIVLIDNRANDVAGYDDEALLELLQSVDGLAGTGFTDDDLAELLAACTKVPPTHSDPDSVPDPPAKAISVVGDVWLLGPHRLACGDSTDVAVWDRLLGDDRPVGVWTDPPYGVNYVGGTKDALTIKNDGHDIVALESLLRLAFSAALEKVAPGAVFYVAAPAGPQTLAFGKVLTDLKLWRQTLVWVKNTFVLGRSDYHYQHEMIYAGEAEAEAAAGEGDEVVEVVDHDALYYGFAAGGGRRGRGSAGWYGPNNASTVLEFPKPAANKVHPTMKPVDLIVACLENSTPNGGIVADPFGGSGSTLIACHMAGRVGRLIELDPRYVDVICRRYQEVTGIVPVLEATGKSRDFTV
jgi:site-specific DNA-methyltransferase (adenine-specific)